MTNNEAHQFAFNSFITTFTPGNEHMIDRYFDANLTLLNHSVSKQFGLNELKSSLPRVHKKYQDIKSEIKDVFVENDRIAFHVKQTAFYVPENRQATMDVMNLYTLCDGKIKEWQMWENFNQK